ncbi:MAG: MBL fold metallo-hydrolase [Holophagales bacterium]|nr:MAG: MBL fold metallo-hydrolase [Holophagales bacterium]
MTLSRRQLLVTGSVAVLGSQLLPRRLAGQPVAAPPKGTFTELRGGVGIFTAQGGTIGWLVTPDAALVVDSQSPETAPVFLEGFRSRTARHAAVLINTHHHDDHTGGNGVLRPFVGSIVAHANVPALQRRSAEQEKAPPPVVADTTFTDAWRMDLGSEAVAARHYGPAHTGGDIAVHFEKADVVHLGDLVFNRIYPFIDRGAGASIRSWITVLEKIAAAHGESTRFIYGHGKRESGVTGGKADLLLQRDFFTALLDHAGRELKAGRSVEEIAGATSLAGFPEHVSPIPFLSLGNCLRVACAELAGG